MKKNTVHIPMPIRYLINAAAIAAIYLIISALSSAGVITNYYTKILILICINIILAVSLNLVTGYLGQLPLGHAGFMAVGAYASGIFMRAVSGSMPTGLAVFLSLILAAIVAGIFGFIIGIPALRLKGDYLAIITLGFGEIIRVVLLNIDSVLGFNFTYGAASLKNIPKTTTFTLAFICVVLLPYSYDDEVPVRARHPVNPRKRNRIRVLRHQDDVFQDDGVRRLRGVCRRGRLPVRRVSRHPQPRQLRLYEVD